MQFTTAAAAATLLFAGSSLADIVTNGGAAPTGAPSSGAPAGQVMVQTVKVGGSNGELTFTPSDIQAPMGSIVQFQFWPKNHSVAQASFAQPCVPITQSNTSVTSQLWSGFMPTPDNATMMATYSVMVNSTTPVWLYCAQGNHCQSGMVASINANNASGKTLAAFQQSAATAQANIAPGGTPSNGTVAAGSGSPSALTNSTGSGSSGSAPSGSAGAPSSTPTSNSKAASAGSTISYSMSSLALAGFLSAVAAFAL